MNENEDITYYDPDNIQEILEEIDDDMVHTDIIQLIFRVFPTWIKNVFDDYSEDYAYLKNNWVAFCSLLKVEPKKIILVDEVRFEKESDNHKLLNKFCSVLSQGGYIVRRKKEFVSCRKCGKALPSKGLYEVMVEKGMPNLPQPWSSYCFNCS